METVDFLLVGGGLAAAKCADALRAQGARGRIMIVGAEAEPPYNRPPLSKKLFLNQEDAARIFVFKEEFYKKNKIDLVLGVRIAKVDGVRKVAKTDDGREYAFGKLLAAAGTTPRHLRVEGGALKNIFYLRNLKDAISLGKAVKSSKKVTVVGAGFIGMELASTFSQNGLKTTMLVRDSGLFTKLGSEALSKFFKQYYLRQGIEMVFNDSVKSFEGQEVVERIVTQDGRSIDCDTVAVGIGVIPETDWLGSSGVELKNGVVVNEYMQSKNPDIYAAGDIANFYDPIFKKHRRIEHWDNAVKQGELAALNMLGKNEPYRTVAYFFSDVFDVTWEWLGDNSETDATITRGSFADQSAIVFYLNQNKLKAALLLMRDVKERKWIEQTIIKGLELDAASQSRLVDDLYPLDQVS